MKNKMTLGKVIDELLICYERACSRPDVRRKWSWALYHTWAWCNEEEEWETKETGKQENCEGE
jgi:hypothetical protein